MEFLIAYVNVLIAVQIWHGDNILAGTLIIVLDYFYTNIEVDDKVEGNAEVYVVHGEIN